MEYVCVFVPPRIRTHDTVLPPFSISFLMEVLCCYEGVASLDGMTRCDCSLLTKAYDETKITTVPISPCFSMPPSRASATPLSAAMERIREEEQSVCQWYHRYVVGASTRYPSSSSTAATSRKKPAIHGPAPPHGWVLDINDPLLLEFDPYFHSVLKKRSEAAPQQLDEIDRHYAQDEVPVSRVSSLPCTTIPSAGVVVTSAHKGRHVIATRAIRAGEVIAMDRSSLSCVTDPLAYRYPPPDVRPDGSGFVAVGSSDGCLQAPAAARQMAAVASFVMQSAATMGFGKEFLISSHRLQMMCSFLIEMGDALLLPRREVARASCVCGKTKLASLFPHASLSRAQLAEAMVADWMSVWWQNSTFSTSGCDLTAVDPISSGNQPHMNNARDETEARRYENRTTSLPPLDAERFHQARLLLQCLPVSLLESHAHSRSTPCCQQQIEVHGFVARVGLQTAARLALWFAIWDDNAIQIHVPDLLGRTAMFPFARFFEHECRPNAQVVVLDCPATHTYGVSGQHHYDTKPHDYVDPYSSEAADQCRRPFTQQQLATLWWPCATSQKIWNPSWIAVTAMRAIAPGESISISYIPASLMPQPTRLRELSTRYHFQCHCQWCTSGADLARGFRCPKCPRNEGVICPAGSGEQLAWWECLQCGYHPDPEEEIPKMLDAEAKLQRVKADKAKGLVALLDDAYVHYSHSLVVQKLDQWSEAAWQEQDGSSCVAFLEALQRATRRVLDPGDPSLAQHHEFMGQVQHALGNAHTARYEYFLAMQIRTLSGGRFAHWTRKTQFMAAEKSLADFLDSR